MPKDSVAGRREFERTMEARRALDDRQTRKAVRRGWCLGSEEFRRELLEQMEGRMGRHHGGVERQETAEQRAAQARGGGVEAAQLGRRRVKAAQEGDPAKAQIAQRLRQETTVTWDWIARGLMMGASGYAANCVRSFLSGA